MSFPTIQKIKDTQCPCCKAEVASVRVYARHISDGWNEEVVFECGASLHYIPNFRDVRIEKSCPKAHDMIVKMRAAGRIVEV